MSCAIVVLKVCRQCAHTFCIGPPGVLFCAAKYRSRSHTLRHLGVHSTCLVVFCKKLFLQCRHSTVVRLFSPACRGCCRSSARSALRRLICRLLRHLMEQYTVARCVRVKLFAQILQETCCGGLGLYTLLLAGFLG